MIHDLTKLIETKLRVPTLELVRRTLHTVDERCPSCYQIRNGFDMVYLDIQGSPHAACRYCLPDSYYAQHVGVDKAIADSEQYVQDMLEATDPFKWQLKPRNRNSPYEPRSMVLEGVAHAIHKSIGKSPVKWRCQGRMGRRMHPNEVDYLDISRLCVHRPGKKLKVFFSRLGAACSMCSHSNADLSASTKTLQDRIDDKLIARCICEGLRYAAWLSVVDRYTEPSPLRLIGDNGYRLQWWDWLRREPVDTTSVETWPLDRLLGVKHYRSKLK